MSRVLAAAPVPVAVKHVLLRTGLRVAGPLLCDTSLVSNLGVIEPPGSAPPPPPSVVLDVRAYAARPVGRRGHAAAGSG